MARYCSSCAASLETTSSECPECSTECPPKGWPEDHLLGKVVVGGQYRVLRRLGAGGFGAVYEVETVVGGLRRALKVLNREWASHAGVRERFVNEALVLEQINHPNVGRCYAAGSLEEDGALYLLLELVSGIDLQALVFPEGVAAPLSPSRAIRLAKQMAAGVAVAHERGILHRDIKPPNVLVVRAGQPSEQVKLLDFGIAKLAPKGASHTDHVVGTPDYMAPEQLSPGASLDARLDLWQLGAVLHFMLTGRPPYPVAEGSSIFSLVARHEKHAEAGPRPSTLRPELSTHPELDRLVAQLLASDPERRPSSAADLCEELARLEHRLRPVTSTSPSVALLEVICADPSDSGWWALCRFLESQGEEREALREVTSALLRTWPDSLRRAPSGWWELARRNEPHPLWPLVRRLDLSGRGLGDADAVRLAENSALAGITELDLSRNRIGDSGVAALAASSHLESLAWLDLSANRIRSQGVAALARAKSLPALRALRLAGNGVGPRGASALGEAKWNLVELDASGNDIGASGARALCVGGLLAGVTTLRLGDNGLGADGAAALASCSHLRGLRELDLSNNDLGAAGAASLAISPHLGGVSRLALGRNDLGREGLEMLLSARRLERLAALDLSGNDIGASGAMLLASSPLARRLEALDVAHNGLGDAGVAALLGAPNLAALHCLSVASNGLSAGSAGLLGGSLPQLETLDLSHNPLGDEGGLALAESLSRMQVRDLRVADCGLGADALGALLRAAEGRLGKLCASSNPLGPEGVEQLVAVAELAQLEELELRDVGAGASGGRAVGASPHLGGLRSLTLGSNGLGDEGASALLRGEGNLLRLESLSLPDERLGLASAVAVATSPLAGRLTRLVLSHNPLGDEGAEALARCPGWHALRELELENTRLGLAGAAALLSAPGTAMIHRLDISHNALTSQADIHSLSHDIIARLEGSFAVVSARGAELADLFYERFFARYPSVEPLFARVDMRRQKHHLMSALVFVIDNLRNPDTVEDALATMGRRHIGYGVFPSHYFAMTQVLVDTLGEILADEWDDDLRQFWLDGIEAVTAVMMRAHHEDLEPGTETTLDMGPRLTERGEKPEEPSIPGPPM
jgi:serine/threonine protein kinase/hemoglobin-like flavoprotein/Ran GTPase-activating protein (RanGAP) involved in mRNA processing and transport